MVGVLADEETMAVQDGWRRNPAFETAEGSRTITSSDFPGTKAAAFARIRPACICANRASVPSFQSRTGEPAPPASESSNASGAAKENPCFLI
jgi:hypothetical protein